MMRALELTTYLQTQFPSYKFYSGTINKKEKCIGVYARGGAPRIGSVGGGTSSYNILPIQILVHWDSDSNTCEAAANVLHEFLDSLPTKTDIGSGRKIINIAMKDTTPVNLNRDENGNYEMSILINIYYERS